MVDYVFCLITILFFSTLEFTGKLIGDSISPLAITAFRFLIGGLLILPFALFQVKKNHLQFKYKDMVNLAIPGILNVVISMFFLQLSIYYGKASLSAIIISANPIFVSIFGSVILKEKFSFPKLMGSFVGIFGIILIIFNEKGSIYESKNIYLGVIFALIAVLSFALYTVVNKKFVIKYGNFVLNSFSFIFGSIILLIVGLIFKQRVMFEFNYENLAYIGYLGIFVTGVAYLLFFEALKHIPASTGAMFFFLKPVFASILAITILHESLSYLQILGILIVLMGMNMENFFRYFQK